MKKVTRKIVHKKGESNQNIETLSNEKSLDNYIKDKGLLILLCLLTLIGFFVFKDYLLLKKLYIFKDIGSDTTNFYYPNLISVSEHLRNYGIPTWSFQQGMGQNIFGLSFNEPFNWILYALGKDNLPYGIAYVELLKIFLVGVFFYKFLQLHRLSSFVSILSSLLLAFSGIMVLGGGWYVFSSEGVHFTLLLFALERYYRSGSWLLIAVAVAVIALFQPFNLFIASLFVLAYSIFRTLYYRTDDLMGYVRHMLRILSVSILGALSTVFIFYSHLLQALNSPRVSGESSYFEKLTSKGVFTFEGLQHNVTAIMRFFSNDILGTGSQFRGWYNYLEAPIFYCGILTLLLFPYSLVNIDSRKRKILLVGLALIFVPIIFPFFRYAFWLFAGDYYRLFSYFVALGLILFSARALQNIFSGQKANKLVIGLSLVGLLLLLNNSFLPENVPIQKDQQNFITFVLIGYSLLLIGFNIKGFKLIAQVAILVFAVVELSYLSSITTSNREVISSNELSQKIGYNDYTVEAIDYLNSIDKGFFRVQKDYNSGLAVHQSFNDAKVFGYNGTPSYHSFNQNSYIEFLSKMNVIDPTNESQTRWSPGIITRPLLQGLMSVKYKLTKTNDPQKVGFGYKQIANFGDVYVYENSFVLPLGFCYDKYVDVNDLSVMEPILRDITLLKAISLEDSIATGGMTKIDFNSYSKNYTLNDLAVDVEQLKKDTLSISSYKIDKIIGKIDLKQSKLLFLSIPYDPSWKAFVNGQKQQIIKANIGFTGLLLNAGLNEVELKFTPPLFYPLTIISIISILIIVTFYIINRCHFNVLKKTTLKSV